jgi:hypothetical protein
MSVVIVCCAVGHAATNARPLMSRPVPRRTRAGSGRRAPGRPRDTPQHALVKTRTQRQTGRHARGIRVVGHERYQHLLGRHDPARYWSAQRRTPPPREEGTLGVARRDKYPAPTVVRTCTIAAYKPTETLFRNTWPLTVPISTRTSWPSSIAASSPAGSAMSAPQSSRSGYACHREPRSGNAALDGHPRDGTHVPSPPVATST